MHRPHGGLTVLVAAVLIVLGCTDPTQDVSTDTTDSSSLDNSSTTSIDQPSSTATTTPTSTEPTSPTSGVTTSETVDPDGLDPEIQTWVNSYCASAQRLEDTLGPDDIEDTPYPDQLKRAAAAANLHDRYQELADIIRSGLDRTSGDFHERSERSAQGLTAAADEYTTIAAALAAEPSGDELEAIIDHHHDVETDALTAAILFLYTPTELRYTVEFDMTESNVGCPFILALSIPDCAIEPDTCPPP